MENVHDIKKKKNLNIILPLNLNYSITASISQRILIVVHLHYASTVNYYLKYMESIPDYIDIIITSSEKEVNKILLQSDISKRINCKIFEKENRGRDISALLVASRKEILKYDYVCFLHDKKAKNTSSINDTSEWIKCLCENTIGSTNYIENVLMTFYENSNLGLLVPPPPICEYDTTIYLNSWTVNYPLTAELAQKMNLHCDLNINKPPLTLGTVFWAKVSALKKLFEIEWTYEDFDDEPLAGDGTISHAIERVLAYVAQDAGYDTGWVMTDRYAGERIEYSHLALASVFSSYGLYEISELKSYENRMNDLLKFVDQFEHIYVYGSGKIGKRCFCMLNNKGKKPTAFLESAVHQDPKVVLGLSVLSIYQINLDNNCGIIIAVDEKYQEEILRTIYSIKQDFPNIHFFVRG